MLGLIQNLLTYHNNNRQYWGALNSYIINLKYYLKNDTRLLLMGLWNTCRDPKRNKKILEKIKMLWKDSPDLRFGEFLQNIFGSTIKDQPIFFKEDDEIERTLDYLINKKKS